MKLLPWLNDYEELLSPDIGRFHHFSWVSSQCSKSVVARLFALGAIVKLESKTRMMTASSVEAFKLHRSLRCLAL